MNGIVTMARRAVSKKFNLPLSDAERAALHELLHAEANNAGAVSEEVRRIVDSVFEKHDVTNIDPGDKSW